MCSRPVRVARQKGHMGTLIATPTVPARSNRVARVAPEIAIDVEQDVVRWHPLVRFVLCIPHLLWAVGLQFASVVVSFAISGAVLVTGRVPAKLGVFQVLCLSERVRAYTYFFLL